MGHNVIAHLVLAAVLFIVASLIFGGGGVYSALFFTTTDVSAVLIGATSDPGGSADNLSVMIPLIFTVIVNTILYYIIAGILILIFDKIRK